MFYRKKPRQLQRLGRVIESEAIGELVTECLTRLQSGTSVCPGDR